jgi:hypothetical protein
VQVESGTNEGSAGLLRNGAEEIATSSGKIQAGGIRSVVFFVNSIACQIFFVADSAFCSFLRLLFSDPDWRQRNADLLQKFAQRPLNTQTRVAPNPLPSYADAQFLVNR